MKFLGTNARDDKSFVSFFCSQSLTVVCRKVLCPSSASSAMIHKTKQENSLWGCAWCQHGNIMVPIGFIKTCLFLNKTLANTWERKWIHGKGRLIRVMVYCQDMQPMGTCFSVKSSVLMYKLCKTYSPFLGEWQVWNVSTDCLPVWQWASFHLEKNCCAHFHDLIKEMLLYF